MVAAARRVGMPETVLEYLSSLYQGSTMRLKVGQSLSGEIVVGRGVRQGDPLLPIVPLCDGLGPERSRPSAWCTVGG